MALSDFHSRVSEELNKSALASFIPARVKDAAQFLERNWNFEYMAKEASTILTNGDSSLSLAGLYVKSFRYVHYTDGDSVRRYLRRISPQEVSELDSAAPQGYWAAASSLGSFQTLRFDAEADTDYTLTLGIWQYTWPLWPTSTSETPVLLAEFEPLLLAQTMLLFGPFIRNPGLMAMYKDQRAEWLRVAGISEEESKYGGTSNVMGYGDGLT